MLSQSFGITGGCSPYRLMHRFTGRTKLIQKKPFRLVPSPAAMLQKYLLYLPVPLRCSSVCSHERAVSKISAPFSLQVQYHLAMQTGGELSCCHMLNDNMLIMCPADVQNMPNKRGGYADSW